MRKKDALQNSEEEDYDDFSEEPEESSDSTRSYVPLNHETASEEQATPTEEQTSEESPSEEAGAGTEEFPIENASDSAKTEKDAQDTFTPLTEQVAKAADNAAEAVEEFFDEDDGPGEEPPISDN